MSGRASCCARQKLRGVFYGDACDGALSEVTAAKGAHRRLSYATRLNYASREVTRQGARSTAAFAHPNPGHQLNSQRRNAGTL